MSYDVIWGAVDLRFWQIHLLEQDAVHEKFIFTLNSFSMLRTIGLHVVHHPPGAAVLGVLWKLQCHFLQLFQLPNVKLMEKWKETESESEVPL